MTRRSHQVPSYIRTKGQEARNSDSTPPDGKKDLPGPLSRCCMKVEWFGWRERGERDEEWARGAVQLKPDGLSDVRQDSPGFLYKSGILSFPPHTEIRKCLLHTWGVAAIRQVECMMLPLCFTGNKEFYKWQTIYLDLSEQFLLLFSFCSVCTWK